MHHLTRLLRTGRHFDQLLDGKRIGLRSHPLHLPVGNQTLRKDAAAPFRQDNGLRANLFGCQIVGLPCAVLVKALLTRPRTDDHALLLDQTCHGIAGVNLHAFLCRNVAEILNYLRERRDGIRPRTHHRRHPWNPHRPCAPQKRTEALFHDMGIDRQLGDFIVRQKTFEP